MEGFYFELRGLTVGYRRQALVRDITLGLDRGRVLSIIGPNGAGKTTILRHITRQMKPLAGCICLEDQPLERISGPALARKAAVVLTQRPRPEQMTCAEVVAAGRYPYTGRFGLLAPSDRQAVRQAMERVGIADLAEHGFAQCSDGQKQRVLLARAICQEPELLILDEPTAYLDLHHKIQLLDLVRSMAQQQRTAVVMTLHEIDLALKVSDVLLCVRGDGNTFFGTPEQVLEHCPPSSLYGVEPGGFDPLTGSVELQKPSGPPQVFVLGGGGRATGCYRALQRRQIPFATGILFENDVDARAARALSSHVTLAPAFEPMTRRHLDAAARDLTRCRLVLDPGVPLGSLNRLNGELLDLARARGIPIRDQL